MSATNLGEPRRIATVCGNMNDLICNAWFMHLYAYSHKHKYIHTCKHSNIHIYRYKKHTYILYISMYAYKVGSIICHFSLFYFFFIASVVLYACIRVCLHSVAVVITVAVRAAFVVARCWLVCSLLLLTRIMYFIISRVMLLWFGCCCCCCCCC